MNIVKPVAEARATTGGRWSIADAVIEIFRREEVPFVAGLPGSGVMQYLDSLYGGASPRFVLVRHEQVGVHMALGCAELTNRPAVMLVSRSRRGLERCHRGPGSAR